MNNIKTDMEPAFETDFAEDVYRGLNKYPKELSSRYFYDQQGDLLFQRIMGLPSYYLTRKEFTILEDHKESITRSFYTRGEFDLIDLGAGDAKKSKILLKEFRKQEVPFRYLPADISSNALAELTAQLDQEMPRLEVQGIQGTYEQILETLPDRQGRRRIFLFLGSNIGNLSPGEAADLLRRISRSMQQEDLFFLGADQKKDPSVILQAYNDPEGITAAFNKNLLHRINRELAADFDPDSFVHWPLYDPVSSQMRSYLLSTKQQEVHIKSLHLVVQLEAWEGIHTENSQKYDDASIGKLAEEAGLRILESYSDAQQYFKNYILNKTVL